MHYPDRRYDIDWLRVIAIILLLIYHIAIVFQPWGIAIAFIQSPENSEAVWIPMAMLNVWRIPLLFFVSGMAVCFALRRRNWKQLLLDRAQRILLPLIFGSFFIVPIHIFIFQIYYKQEIVYSPGLGHLWFLANICIYVLQITSLTFLEKSYDYKFFNILRRLLKRPYFIYIFIIPFILEAEILNPEYFSLFVGTAHGFIIGMLAFFFGFLFVALGDAFWDAVAKLRTINLIIAFILYLMRLIFFHFETPGYLASIESMNWIFAVLGFGYKYLNKPSKILNYLCHAAYPVYIIHMIFLQVSSFIILPMNLPLGISFMFIVLSTFICSFITYEFVIRKIDLVRPFFGLKRKYKLLTSYE